MNEFRSQIITVTAHRMYIIIILQCMYMYLWNDIVHVQSVEYINIFGTWNKIAHGSAKYTDATALDKTSHSQKMIETSYMYLIHDLTKVIPLFTLSHRGSDHSPLVVTFSCHLCHVVYSDQTVKASEIPSVV